MLFSFSRFLLFFFISFFFTCSDELTLYSSRRLKRSVAFRTFLRVFLRPLLGIKAEILVNLDKTVEAQTGSELFIGRKKNSAADRTFLHDHGSISSTSFFFFLCRRKCCTCSRYCRRHFCPFLTNQLHFTGPDWCRLFGSD